MKNVYYACVPLMLLLGCGDGKVDCADPDKVMTMSSAEIKECTLKSHLPYEYIDVEGYGEDWKSTDDNVYRLHMPKISEKKFEIGTGACERYLKRIEKEDVSIHRAVTNDLIQTHRDGRSDVMIKHARLQCIAMKGIDQNCEERKETAFRNLLESGQFDKRVAIGILFISCRMLEDVGEPRAF